MTDLSDTPTLKELQAHFAQICKQRGWDKNTPAEIFLLLTEEVGELAKALRGEIKLKFESKESDRENLEEELADIFMYLLHLANHFDIDLESAYRKKDRENASRTW